MDLTWGHMWLECRRHGAGMGRQGGVKGALAQAWHKQLHAAPAAILTQLESSSCCWPRPPPHLFQTRCLTPEERRACAGPQSELLG